ncbi:Tyrosine kinase specific for activated (GTP-bound) p21cdc42Hs [Plasmopara halstedii]|uniref:Tyrosine kinase specific for activated (GTP-bound) p21cdc42Hs n=1 Tax=Plasmopara halstedii TaxID=4781 RepID=A0A0P1APG9_PLAHL|nr:Tyrosine kinase specific for activated (GTP-bound) p21cdc42Hs [Plasmopara halstedii]CEG42910.1 Tyrosine kinase specific for activated (GTP-bound) p21cdc42Hs [Plasmopara halstedii]|eukprot:XP_024579279.1 Tyrosine kinase specific for activated (GTP-bound) p21cdc42Hs [Plasmopara halstedii]
MNSKHAALWDEVQGPCETPMLQAALGADVDPTALLDGWTPIHFLCENCLVKPAARTEGLRLLLLANFDANVVDERGWSALHLLCTNKSGSEEDLVPSIHQLLSAGANVDLQTSDNKKSALHFLCGNEALSIDTLEAVLQAKPDLNLVDSHGNVALHYLAENCFVSNRMFSLMLEAGANLNHQNHFQSTPTHYICQNSRVTGIVIRELLKHKANFNIKNNIGYTPIHYLCENNVLTVDMLKEILRDKHVNITITNSLGKLASDCIPFQNHDCRAYLQKFVAPNLNRASGNITASSPIGGEDPNELPEPLKKTLTAWNASLPPFDEAFYNAISCEAAFESIYVEVQEISRRACDTPGDIAAFTSWKKSLGKWRNCILLAYAALIPPDIWHRYAELFQRPVPSDMLKLRGEIEKAWMQYPDQIQRRGRFEALSGVFNN